MGFGRGERTMVIRESRGDRLFAAFCAILLTLFVISILYPLYFVVIASVSSPMYVNSGEFLLYPRGLTLAGYEQVFRNEKIWIGYGNSLLYTVFGVLLGATVTVMAGYALSYKELKGRGIIMGFMVVTMYFGGGLIPFYWIVNRLGLMNTRVLMVILGSVSTYNIIMVRAFFLSSEVRELRDAAFIDGCGHGRFFLRIAVPLAKPILATIALFYAVDKWNEWWNSMLYINRMEMYPLQLILQNIINTYQSATDRNIASADALNRLKTFSMGIKMAAIVVTMLPIMCVFPFLQRFFVKGIMIGAVKG